MTSRTAGSVSVVIMGFPSLWAVRQYVPAGSGRLIGRAAMGSGPPAGMYREREDGGCGDGEERGFREPDRAVPAGVARALLPHARFGARRRGPRAGHNAAGMAGLRHVRRGSRVVA